MKGFGVHTSMWALEWTREGAERAISEASQYQGIDFLEITMLDPPGVDAPHTRALLEKAELNAVCSLGVPLHCLPSQVPDKAFDFLKLAIDKTVALGGQSLTGVTYGGIGERTGKPPTQKELDNVAITMRQTADYAKKQGIELGIEVINRYENHLFNTAWQAVELLERIGSDNIFIHLDTYHMNIEEKGVVNGILDCKEHLKYIHLSESDRGVPGTGTCDWEEVFAGLAAVGFKGGMTMESFINLPPQIASALSVWRPVAESPEEVMTDGLSFLRNKAKQYRLL
ncbi:sugar phosphate isomerase/epimerase family protein [Vibrio penaeicida]|uniref:Tagatose 3-epimerase n=1 Tax=Vibrio penaeicida TaxID=104609 RepID=A0AAV5NZW0_9VIBR|nr:sugar phosphate isomerase/epimerase [Vibrio penaeicida]RTZ24183.1 sugar phosphate isomerase/epimerase [Vibrio penaeicida]GLQ76236.1 tagatose 3-epimerase [Vibrio penaeicida]